MEIAGNSRSRTYGRRKQQLLLLAAVLVCLGGVLVFVSWRNPTTSSALGRDPLSPYLNTRAGVKYLGDAACVGCHKQSTEGYRQHPMGRSLAPIGESYVNLGGEADGRTLFENQGLSYSIEDREGRVFHHETRRDAAGRTVASIEAEVQFVIGSGRQGTAYVIDRDGFLFESPLTWYSRKQRWDLSPGFEAFNYHFERPIKPNCLFCHTNHVELEPGAINRYRQPLFQGHAIGCERCHGPGELHVARPAVVDGVDMTIVNPADLPPAQQDDVCAQCHLAGSSRVVRVGRRNEDYRPGLPFDRFWTVFVVPPDVAEDRFVGQFEQLHESRCYGASGGALSCISCHDPHHFPAPEERAAYYRARCLACHADQGCSLPASARLVQSKDDNCAGCHLPKASSLDIPHAATSNHRILRQVGKLDPSLARPRSTRRDRLHLLPFYRDRIANGDRTGLERDRGVALCREGAEGARTAVPLLEAALTARPEDVIAWESLGSALSVLDRFQEALVAYQKALGLEAGRESTLVEAARLCLKCNRNQDAAAYWRQAIGIDPWRSDYHAELAFVCFSEHNWRGATDACQNALRLNPSSIKVRKLLVQCLLNLGRIDAARRELDAVLGFDPPDRADLLESFSEQSKSGRSAR